MIPQPKIKNSDLILKCENVKDELAESMNEENKRVNIDSAKKRAVFQGMDYDGFRQMVLGANIFPIKSKEFAELTSDKTMRSGIVNSSFITFNKDKENIGDNDKTIEFIKSLNLNSQMTCHNFKEFRKIFDNIFKKPINLDVSTNIYQLLQNQSKENLISIFALDFDVEYFIKIIDGIETILNELIIPNQSINDLIFIAQFLNTLTEIKNFKIMVPKFLSLFEKKKLKKFITNFCEKCRDLFPEDKEFIINIEMFYIEKN